MSDTVSQFVLTKAPLELWLYEQQDYYNSLPLLETDIDELCRQREEFEAEKASILSHSQNVEHLVKLSQQFCRSKQVSKILYNEECAIVYDPLYRVHTTR